MKCSFQNSYILYPIRVFEKSLMHGNVTCRFKTAMAVLIPLQGLEMAWPFRNGQMIDLAILKQPTIPLGHFDTSLV